MSTVLKWLGVLVIILSLLPLALGIVLALEVYAHVPAPHERDITVLETLIYSMAGQLVFMLSAGFAMVSFMVGAVSYYVGNSGIQGSKQLALWRELLREMKRIEYAD